jgi:cell division protein FtsW
MLAGVDSSVMLRAGHGLILIAICLLTLGVVMVNSAGLTVASENRITLEAVLTGRPTMLALLAFAALFAGSIMPVNLLYRTRGLSSPVPWIAIGCVTLLVAVHVPQLGKEVYGAVRWINLGPLSFQPSEVAKWGVLIILAWHATRRTGAMHKLLTGFLPPMLFVGFLCALIALEDLGTAVLIGMVALIVLVAGGVRIWQAAMVLPMGAAAFVGAVIIAPYRLARLTAFMDPYADPQGTGYHMIQSMAAVAGGGLAGRGLGNSIHKFGYLPEDTTDFIFAVICEEFGVIGCAIVISLYVALIFCALSILRRAQHPFHQLLALGVIATLGLQTLINLMVVTGLAPTKGIALPLISHGGTGWIMTCFFIGLMASMDKQMVREEDAVMADELHDVGAAPELDDAAVAAASLPGQAG